MGNGADIGIRKKLVEAGLKELLEHGSRDFSLRRVALMAEVSCAAPYRHFKDKDELVRAVISEIRENWLLISSEIAKIFPIGSIENITELLRASVRFWVAGDNFAPFLSVGEIAGFDAPIISSVEVYATARGLDENEKKRITASLLALEYGTVTLILSGRSSAENGVANMCEMAEGILAK